MSDFGLFLLMCAGLLLALGLLRFLAWLTDLQDEHGSLGRAGISTVKRYVAARPRVMSRSEESAPPSIASALQTDNRQTTDRPAAPPVSRDVMLTTFKLLRKYGVPREEARTMLRGLGMPLDNNLWTDAAQPDTEPAHVTPIVGRATNARFEQPTDADFPFQPLA